MDVIKSYLESMFAQLPNTPEVWRAKDELLQMMEDRYNDLLGEGKSENEAVGSVIAEFGNLNEVAESLGIGTFVREQSPQADLPEFTLEEADQMINDRSTTSLLRGLAVLLFIISPVGFNLSEWLLHGYGELFGLIFLVVCIVSGIGLMVFSGVIDSKWKYVKRTPYRIDHLTASEVYEQNESYRITHALLKAVGIVLIVLSFVPAAVIEGIGLPESLEDGLGGSLLLILTGMGVMTLIFTSGRNKVYEDILKMNDRSTIAGSYVPAKVEEIRYSNETVSTIMSVYWHTVTCIYLVWSFLTFAWWKTWIIWPVAAIVHGLLNSAFAEKGGQR